jgi:hypothetical protein
MQKYPDITGLYLGNENQDTLIVQRAASSLVAAVKEGLALVSYLYGKNGIKYNLNLYRPKNNQNYREGIYNKPCL